MQTIANTSRTLGRSVRLLGSAAPREISVLTVTQLLEGIIPALSIWINQQVVDAVVTAVTEKSTVNPWSIAGLAAGWTFALFLDNLLTPWSNLAFRNADERLEANLHVQLIDKANQFQDLQRFEESRFYDELQLLQEQLKRQPSQLLISLALATRELLTAVTLVILIVPLGWWIPVLILMTSLPQTYLSFKMYQDAWDVMSHKSLQSRQMQYFSSVLLTDTYAKEVRLFNLSHFFRDRYQQAFADKYQALSYLWRKQAGLTTGVSIIGAVGNAVAFGWVVWQAISRRLTPGQVLVFIQSLTYTQQNLMGLLNSVSRLQESLVFLEQFFTFLDAPLTLPLSCPGHAVPSPLRSGIVFDQVHFHYPDGRAALTDISFQIFPGETVALVGENGAGKTTLVKLLARFYDPSLGCIRVDDHDLKTFDLAAWRAQIAVVFQDFCRYALTIEENMALGNLDALNDPIRIKQIAHQAALNCRVANGRK
jgi:ATP-binding cassette, subfamily B, bacterial